MFHPEAEALVFGDCWHIGKVVVSAGSSSAAGAANLTWLETRSANRAQLRTISEDIVSVSHADVRLAPVVSPYSNVLSCVSYSLSWLELSSAGSRSGHEVPNWYSY